MKKIKIIELNIIERMQLGYCGDITFSYNSKSQFTPIGVTISNEQMEDFDGCFKNLKKRMKEYVKTEEFKLSKTKPDVNNQFPKNHQPKNINT